MKFKNDVSIHEQHLSGYGGPETWVITVVFDNRQIERQEHTDARSLGCALAKLEAKYGLLTRKALASLARGKKQAFGLCDSCGKPSEGGGVSMGVTQEVASMRSKSGLHTNPWWCRSCHEKAPGVIGASHRT